MHVHIGRTKVIARLSVPDLRDIAYSVDLKPRAPQRRAHDNVAARQALATILDGKVRFTPIERDTRPYRFEAKLTLGRILEASAAE